MRTAPLEHSLPASAPQPEAIALIRLAALRCRAAPRGSLAACALLDPSAGSGAHAAMLAALLPQMLERRPVLYRPGTPLLSFDEDWLLALMRAAARGDRSSERFLMRSRVRPSARPALRLLLAGLIRGLDDGADSLM
jgi:hypothetical protein